jgi:Lon protease-like protein
MFPLGTVLFPTMVLPLHVFETRYRVMMRHCLDTEPEFGVVLIERGSEVGGNDVRTGIGTVARILEANELPDGRWVLGAVGTRRIRVREWLADDPYPRAEVDDLVDSRATPDSPAAYDGAVRGMRRVLALKAELAEAAPAATIELSDDPALGSFQIAAVAPIGVLDRQRVLALGSPDERLALLAELLDEEETYLRRRLETGG